MSAPARFPTACLRCGGRLEAGFLLGENHGLFSAGRWVDGEPVKSFWLGLKLRGRRKIRITSLRCRSCGRLEQYAPE